MLPLYAQFEQTRKPATQDPWSARAVYGNRPDLATGDCTMIESPPTVQAAAAVGADIHDSGADPPQESLRKPNSVGCLFAPLSPRIGERSPEAYSELLEEL